MSLRLSQPTVDTHMRRELDRSFLSRHVVKGVCTGDPYLISSMTMGSRVSLGKSKWSAGTVASGVENTTIFSVHKAPELMAAAPKHVNGVESRAARHMVDNSFVEIAGKKVKLMPDPGPGRAMEVGRHTRHLGHRCAHRRHVQDPRHQKHGRPPRGDEQGIDAHR